jgi:hypothetical protein
MLGPAVVVVASVATLWLAVTSNDGLVADDYYKRGLAINQTLARAEMSRTMGLAAKLRIDGQGVVVQLSAREGVVLPEQLRLTLSHPTRSGLDAVVSLGGTSGTYRGAAPPLSDGRWQVLLDDPGRSWRLAGVLRVPDEPEIELLPPK